MAEQFILVNAKTKELKSFMKTVTCTVTVVAHTHVGWTDVSRTAYNGMLGISGALAPASRAGLPPHFYLEIPTQTNVPNTADTDLVRKLSRGKSPTVLKALDKESASTWAEGRCFEAINAELKKGNVSISVYHVDGVEVDTALRNKIDGFNKAKV